MDQKVGRSASGHQSDDAIYKGFFIEDIADGGVVVAERGDGERAFCAFYRKGVAQRCIRIHETGSGQVEAHELHQHLVGVSCAVEGTGSRAVVAGHLGFQQLFAADFALGV